MHRSCFRQLRQGFVKCFFTYGFDKQGLVDLQLPGSNTDIFGQKMGSLNGAEDKDKQGGAQGHNDIGNHAQGHTLPEVQDTATVLLFKFFKADKNKDDIQQNAGIEKRVEQQGVPAQIIQYYQGQDIHGRPDKPIFKGHQKKRVLRFKYQNC